MFIASPSQHVGNEREIFNDFGFHWRWTNNNGRDMGDERPRTCSGPGGDDDTSARQTINTSAACTDTHIFKWKKAAVLL